MNSKQQEFGLISTSETMDQQSPTFLAPETGFMEDDFSTDWVGGWCRDAAAAAAKLLQLCPTLYDPIDGSPPGSPVPGILQARTLEWVAVDFSNAQK